MYAIRSYYELLGTLQAVTVGEELVLVQPQLLAGDVDLGVVSFVWHLFRYPLLAATCRFPVFYCRAWPRPRSSWPGVSVITSYSIHYTKLYDRKRDDDQQNDANDDTN